VAGAFYPADSEALEAEVRRCLGPAQERRAAFGAIAPHAGYIYSGEVAGAVYSRIDLCRRIVVLCPNHTGFGASAALDPHDFWETPLGRVSLDRELADEFLERCPSLQEDPRAHSREHSLEVHLPFLQICRPDASIVPISIGAPSLALCREIGEAFAEIAADFSSAIQLIASSDMNHFESRTVGDRKNALALARILAIDAEGLYQTVLSEDISMCGFLPATALLFAAARRGGLEAEVVAVSDSGARTGDPSSVVGYAGVVVR
jgi:MEMO1 family protein